MKQSTKVQTHNKSQTHQLHLPNNYELVHGYQYNNQQGWFELYDMAEEFLKDYKKDGDWDAQHLNSLINIEQIVGPTQGYAKGVRDTKTGELQCLLVGQMMKNWWFNRIDFSIICILKRQKCNPILVAWLIQHSERWAKENHASSSYIETWQFKESYIRWAERLKYKKRSYVLQKELK